MFADGINTFYAPISIDGQPNQMLRFFDKFNSYLFALNVGNFNVNKVALFFKVIPEEAYNHSFLLLKIFAF